MICPYCRGSLLDGRHDMTEFHTESGVIPIIGCPQHPENPFATPLQSLVVPVLATDESESP